MEANQDPSEEIHVHLQLTFHRRLEEILVSAPPQPILPGDHREELGTLHGEDELLSFLEVVDARFLIRLAPLRRDGFQTLTRDPITPRELVSALMDRFKREDSSWEPVFEGQRPAAEDGPLRTPLKDLRLASLSLDALEKARKWFEDRAGRRTSLP